MEAKKSFSCLLLVAFPALMATAQTGEKKITVGGSIHSDVLFPQDDDRIGTEKTSCDVQTNTYADVYATSKYVDAGLRLEYLEHPLPGFEKDFKGNGVSYLYLKGKLNSAELTVGNIYEQFGMGFILRTYEERSLGIDNSLLGGRIVVRPTDGVTVKALSGKQRRYWAHNDAWVSGADAELSLDRWLNAFSSSGVYLTLGLSWVNKHEKKEDLMVDKTHKLNFPENVNAFDLRLNAQREAFSLLAEYAWKTDDPGSDNGYIYRHGSIAMLSASYSKNGLSVLLQSKRSDNMAFRSSRMETGISSYINHLPAFTMEHTYALTSLYPYATQSDGEWAFQMEAGYNFKRGTTVGGRYGTRLKLNYSYVTGIDRNTHRGGSAGTDGYGSAFWRWGDKTYYQDLNIQFEKKLSAQLSLNLMYMNQLYNQTVVEGHGGMVRSDIYVAEGKYRFSRKTTLRSELQYLHTGEDNGDWLFALAELSLLPHWMITLSDMYNSGATNTHYYHGYVTFNTGSHRFQLGYGRTRAGYNCSGGVCRYVPASKGATVSYNYNF